MKTPTMKNIDHSGRAIVGTVATTYHPAAGSNENLELILTQIYKEVCSKNTQVTVNVPEVDAPIVNVSLPEPSIVNKVDINQQAQPITVKFDLPTGLIFLNIGLSLLSIAVAIWALVK